MLAHPLNAFLDSRAALTRAAVRGHGTVDLAPTRDCDSLIATFAMFIARLARATQFELALTEARTTLRSATLRIRLDRTATVAAMHCEVDAALAQARAELTASRNVPPLPVGIALVTRLDDPLPAARLLTLVLSQAGAARWHFDQEAFSRAQIHALADRFTALLEIRATARWIHAPVPGAPIEVLRASKVSPAAPAYSSSPGA